MEYGDKLEHEFSEEKNNEIKELVDKKFKELNINCDNLETDNKKINGQNYALISIIAPNTRQKHENICLKIKGVFSSIDEANTHAKILQSLDNTFDIYIVEMYSWLLLPPNNELIDEKYTDNKLNELIDGHKKNQLEAKIRYDERKKELTKDCIFKDKNIEYLTSNGNNCPNSAPSSSESYKPSEILEEMNNSSNINWGDRA